MRLIFSFLLVAILGLFDEAVGVTSSSYICNDLAADSANFLLKQLDPFTGLPYDHLSCLCRWRTPAGVCQSSGVIPQLEAADITLFEEADGTPPTAVNWSFLDALSSGDEPTLLYALELSFQLTAGNSFAGLVWGANVDASRYDRIRIRYRTSDPTADFELKLNTGCPGTTRVEDTVRLPGTLSSEHWEERTFHIASEFPRVNQAELNSIVLAASLSTTAVPKAVLWIDHIALLADPAHITDCGPPVGSCYPDLADYEPYTGAVNIANVVAALTLLPEVGLLDTAEAESRVAKIVDSLSQTPRNRSFIQDWHSPASLMPKPDNRIGSTTDLPQLYAALMVAEETWPEPLRADIRSLREGLFDLSLLWDAAPSGDCPGRLNWATVVAHNQKSLGPQTSPFVSYRS
jgi:hypothetical protein